MFQETDNQSDPQITRRSRNSDNRLSETRKSEERPPLVFGQVSGFNVPQHITDSDPDHHYCFVLLRDKQGTQFTQNYYECQDRGYWPVPKSEHPSLARQYDTGPLQRDETMEKYIIIKGHILMKRRMEDHKAEDRLYNFKNVHDAEMSRMFKVGGNLQYENVR